MPPVIGPGGLLGTLVSGLLQMHLAAVGAAILLTLLAPAPSAQQPQPGTAPANPGQTPPTAGRGGAWADRCGDGAG